MSGALQRTHDPGGNVKRTVWLARLDRATWIASAEAAVLGLILVSGPGKWVRLLIGVPVLVHLAYTTMTSLPMGQIATRPEGVNRVRQNQDLRTCVVGFLNEVRRVEDYANRARTAGLPTEAVDQSLERGQRRIMVAAKQVAKFTGQAVPDQVPR